VTMRYDVTVHELTRKAGEPRVDVGCPFTLASGRCILSFMFCVRLGTYLHMYLPEVETLLNKLGLTRKKILGGR